MKASFNNALLDSAIVKINELKMDLKALKSDSNNYRAGYLNGLEKTNEILKSLKDY